MENNWLSLDWYLYELESYKDYDYANPIFLKLILAIPILLILRWLIKFFWTKSGLETSLFTQKSGGSNSWIAFFLLIPDLFLGLCFFFALIALARPQKSNEEVERWSEGIDIMLSIDISGSMDGMDLKPNRLESAKQTAEEFIDGRFQDRIGLVLFAGEAFSKSPLTTDYEMLKEQVRDVNFEEIAKDGTAIGTSLAVSIKRMEQSKAKSKVIILLSDGDNTAGNIDPLTAAQLAYSFNIKVYTIGVGRKGKVPYNVKGRDFFGRVVSQIQYADNSFDETTLKKIASITEGKYFRATNNQSLREIFKTIDQYEKTEIKENRYKSVKDYYLPYLYASILCLLIWLAFKSTFLTNILED
ncbi:MAG: VWA domain-containing protein [Cytophagales bacterium]|nr:VWA domain-containing protein [Cytophagales bacterium]